MAAAALLLTAGLSQPGLAPLLAAPIMAAPATVAPLAPQVCPLVVTSTSDNVAGSLRAAVNCATTGQTVIFSSALAHQTVNVTAGDIAVVLPITIDASAAPGVIVDAGNTSRVFNITSSGAVILKGMALQRGHAASGNGGALLAGSSTALTLDQVQVLSSTAPAGGGGGLYGTFMAILTGTQFISNTSIAAAGGAVVAGAAVLSNASFQGNQCTGSGCQAGGLGVVGRLTVTSTDFISNTSTSHGGGIYAGSDALLTGGRFERNTCTQSGCQGGGLSAAGAVTITGTRFISNTSVLYGGGVAAAGAARVTNVQFQDNQCTQPITIMPGSGCAGGGLAAGSALTATGTDFTQNTGIAAAGAVYAINSAQLINDRFDSNRCTEATCLGGALAAVGYIDVRSSSFSGNQSAGSGGAVAISGTTQITLTNVTLSGNLASVSGGGLFAGTPSLVGLFNVTLADNQAPSGGGLLSQPGATVGISNTIFSNNGTDNCSGPIANGTHNLDWPGGTCATAGPSAGFTSANPYLGLLALNPPGTTLTRALLIGSPARDQGDPATCAHAPVNNVDQRGVARPIDGNLVPDALCDIGAFEAGRPFLFLPLVRR